MNEGDLKDVFTETVRYLFREFEQQRPKKVSIVTHKRPDIDALASAHALGKMISQICEETEVNVFSIDSLPLKSKKIAEYLDLTPASDHNALKDCAWLFFLDIGDISAAGFPLEFWDSLPGKKILMNHHSSPQSYPYDFKIVKDVTSMSEVVLEVYEALDFKLEEKEATGLMAGVISDSAGLRTANMNTIATLCRLQSLGGNIEVAWSLVTREMERDERIARLKAAQRCIIQKISDFLVAYSEIGSFHASCANSLVTLGADLAVVMSGADGTTNVSLRASKRFYEGTRLSAGVISAEIAKALGGHGGGHKMAAAFIVPKNPDEIKAAVQKFITKYLDKK